MPISSYRGVQGKGKSTALFFDYLRLLANTSYLGDDSYGNVENGVKGFHYIDSEDVPEVMDRMLTARVRHIVWLVDDASAIFPARGYVNRKQSETLKRIWLDRRLFWWVFYTCHVGKSVDLILDEATQFIVLPHFDVETWTVPYDVIMVDKMWTESGVITAEQVRYVQQYFDSWAG